MCQINSFAMSLSDYMFMSGLCCPEEEEEEEEGMLEV